MNDALQPPPGGRQNRGTAFLIVVLVFTVLAWVFLTPRIYIRAFVKRAIGWDDAFIVLSLVSSLARMLNIMDCVLTKPGPCNNLHRLHRPRCRRRLRPTPLLALAPSAQ